MKQTMIRVEHARHVATVTLARPEMRNAFNEEMITELTQVFGALGDEVGVRAIVLAADGSAFCAGADLNWMRRMAGYTREENLADAARLAEMLRVIHVCPKPVVARVQGDAYAGGLRLVAACDMAVSADVAHYCLSEVRLGLIPATISPYVIRAMGARAAHRWFLTGERFPASEALRTGLVHEVVAPDLLDTAVAAITASIAACGPDGVRECKRLLLQVAGRPIDAPLVARTVEMIADARASAQGREGVQSFLDKRKPAWLQDA